MEVLLCSTPSARHAVSSPSAASAPWADAAGQADQFTAGPVADVLALRDQREEIALKPLVGAGIAERAAVGQRSEATRRRRRAPGFDGFRGQDLQGQRVGFGQSFGVAHIQPQESRRAWVIADGHHPPHLDALNGACLRSEPATRRQVRGQDSPLQARAHVRRQQIIVAGHAFQERQSALCRFRWRHSERWVRAAARSARAVRP